MKRSIRNDENAVSLTVSYIMFSAMLITFFIIISMSLDNALLERQSDIVIEEGFSDVGNMISTTLTDVYLIAPENGVIDTNFQVPTKIGNEYYTINAEAASTDQIIEVYSQSSHRRAYVTISGTAYTIPINGTALSSEMEHKINYDSRRL